MRGWSGLRANLNFRVSGDVDFLFFHCGRECGLAFGFRHNFSGYTPLSVFAFEIGIFQFGEFVVVSFHASNYIDDYLYVEDNNRDIVSGNTVQSFKVLWAQFKVLKRKFALLHFVQFFFAGLSRCLICSWVSAGITLSYRLSNSLGLVISSSAIKLSMLKSFCAISLLSSRLI